MLVITNFRNRVVNLTINLWVGDKSDSMQMVVTTYPLLKEATTWIKKAVTLLNQELSHVRLMLIFESKYTKTKGLFTICRVRNRRTWIWCSIILMISAMVIQQDKHQMEGVLQQVVPLTMVDVKSFTVWMVLRPREACVLKTIFTNQKA